MAKLRVVQSDGQRPARQAEPRQLQALLAAAQILKQMSGHVLDQISRDGPHGELYDELRAGGQGDLTGSAASIARVTEELLNR